MRTIILAALFTAAALLALGLALPATAHDARNDPGGPLGEAARTICAAKGLETGTAEFRACYDEEVMRLTVERSRRIGGGA